MAGPLKNKINIIVLIVIIGFAVGVYILCRIHDARIANKGIIYMPKFAPEYLKEMAREKYTVVETEPNDPNISSEKIKELINQQEF